MNSLKPKWLLKRARYDKSLSIKEVSQLSLIDETTLRQYEKNEIPLSIEDQKTLVGILELEQYDDHEVIKEYTPKHFWQTLSIKPYDHEYHMGIYEYIKHGLKNVWRAFKTNRFLIEVLILTLIIISLAEYTGNVSLSILLNSIFPPAALAVGLYLFYKEKHIKPFDAIKLFIIGGLLGIVFTYLFREITGYPFGLIGDLITGFLEEAAKIVVVVFALKYYKTITVKGGIMIGFLIGAGFDAFETADYGIWMLLETFDINQALSLVVDRGFYGFIGIGHHFWTGILAGTLVYLNNLDSFSIKKITKPLFIEMFIVVSLIHAFWNYLVGYNIYLNYGYALLSLLFFILFIRHASYEEVYNNHAIIVDYTD
ncbi:MAG: PrsW family glutamic-type intramembrane protease [Candidatus Izemoplasmataceae bacterium]